MSPYLQYNVYTHDVGAQSNAPVKKKLNKNIYLYRNNRAGSNLNILNAQPQI